MESAGSRFLSLEGEGDAMGQSWVVIRCVASKFGESGRPDA